jgi:hypothetical protein
MGRMRRSGKGLCRRKSKAPLISALVTFAPPLCSLDAYADVVLSLNFRFFFSSMNKDDTAWETEIEQALLDNGE